MQKYNKNKKVGNDIAVFRSVCTIFGLYYSLKLGCISENYK